MRLDNGISKRQLGLTKQRPVNKRPHSNALKFMDGCASDWSYFVPCETDVSAALQRLREDVFERGEFATEDSMIASYRYLQDFPHKCKPASIEELLNQEDETGTHSILDITCISPKPKRRAISRLPDSVLADFGLDGTPSHAVIEDVYEFGSLDKYVNKP